MIYKEQKEELEEALTDEKERNKEIGFLEFEIQEIRQAELQDRRMRHWRKHIAG